MRAGVGRVFRFGAFEFDSSVSELRKDGIRLRVPDQSLAILALLLDRPGEMVTREEIRERLWPNGTIVEFEHSVNSAVKRLRQALLDDAATPLFIETLPKRGYRFIAEVETNGPLAVPAHYRILGEAGRGAMGVVYRAEDVRLGRMVALKALPVELASDPQWKSRLMREARAASALNHPNIVTIHDIASENGNDFIVMEYVEGKSLGESIGPKGMPPKEAIQLAIQISGALAAAHAAGIIHRDLKPGNILVTASGAAKLLDFGVAKIVPDRTGTATSTGTLVGTSGYMSPEQASGGQVDARSDIFAFGAVLYEIVTGRKAFARDTHVDTLAAILHDEPRPPSEIARGLPADLERIILRCLRKERDERFQTMAEVQTTLQALARDLESGHVARVRRPWRRPLVVAALPALSLVAAIGWWLLRQDPEPEPKLVPSSYPGFANHPSFSPDGNELAYSSWLKLGDTPYVYIRQIGSKASPVRLTTGTAEEAFPAWSPDGRYIAFIRAGKNEWSLHLKPPRGGTELTVAEFQPNTLSWGLSWTPDSKWLALPIRNVPGGPSSIWIISIESGERRQVTKGKGIVSDVTFVDMRPTISPDGRWLAFARQPRVPHYGASAFPYVLRLSRDWRPEGEPRPLTREAYSWITSIAWTADSRSIVYTAGGGYSKSMFRVSASGDGTPARVSYVSGDVSQVAISQAQPRLAYNLRFTNVNLWRLDTRSRERKMLIQSSRVDFTPHYSPDGRKLAFQSDRSGSGVAWACDADGTNCAEISIFGAADSGTPRWSPDNRYIAFDAWTSDGKYEIYIVQGQGGPARRLTDHPADDNMPSWSHDGRWVYFSSSRTGRFEIWKVPSYGGTPVQVTRGGGFGAFESGDGKDLYFLRTAATPAPLLRVPVGGGDEVQVLPTVKCGHCFSATSTAVYYFDAQAPDEVRKLDLATGKVSSLAASEKPADQGIAASPDDAFVVWPQLDHMSHELMLVEGFR